MQPNSILPIILLLFGCDGLAPSNSVQRSSEVVTVTDEPFEENVSEASEGVGAPMAWRVMEGAAFYGAAKQPPAFALRCDRSQNSILFERAGGGTAINISAGGSAVSLGTRQVSGGRVQARTGMGDAVLDAMARSQAQITVSGGPEPLTLTGGVAVRRVVDFCRTPPVPVAPPIDNMVVPVEPPALPTPTPTPTPIEL